MISSCIKSVLLLLITVTPTPKFSGSATVNSFKDTSRYLHTAKRCQVSSSCSATNKRLHPSESNYLKNCALFHQEHCKKHSCCEEIDGEYIICSKRSLIGNNTKHSFDVSSAHEVMQLLNHFNFTIHVPNYKMEQTYNASLTKHGNESTFYCENLIYNLSNHFCEYFYYNLSSCSSVTNTKLTYIESWVPFLIFGLLSLIGNCIVIYKNVMALKKNLILHKPMHIYDVLVLNLAIADFLMGIYLVAIGIELQNKIKNDLYFSENTLCNALGIINFVSSEVSLTLLVIISFFRLHSVKNPYKIQRLRIALVLVATTWVVWIIIAFMPTFNFEPFVSFFALGIRFEKAVINQNIVFFHRVREFLNETFTKSYETSRLHEILMAITKYPTIDVLIKILDRFGLSHYQPSWLITGFYDAQYMCSISYLASNNFTTTRKLFILGVVIYNLLCSVCIIIVYSIIFKTIFQCRGKGNSAQSKGLRSIKFSINRKSRNHRREAENRKMFRLIAIVVATDVACWIPICLTSLVLYTGLDSDSHCDFVTAYNSIQLFLSCIVVVNSIINPYIYSFHFWKSLYVRLKQKVFPDNTAN